MKKKKLYLLNVKTAHSFSEIQLRELSLIKQTTLNSKLKSCFITGDYSLEIYPVILEDDAQYQCQVGPGPAGEPAARSRFAQLTVYTPPEPPRIVQGERLLTTEDREIELECVSLAGKPAAEITWIDGFGNVINDNIEYLAESLPDGRRFNARSILKLTPKKEHHNTTFTCQAQNQAERTYRSAKLTLEVKYAPKVICFYIYHYYKTNFIYDYKFLDK